MQIFAPSNSVQPAGPVGAKSDVRIFISAAFICRYPNASTAVATKTYV